MTQNPDTAEQPRSIATQPGRIAEEYAGSTDNHDVDILFNNGKPDFNEKAPIALYKDDTVTVRLKNFPATFKIEALDFYHNKVVGGQDLKDKASSAGSWTRADGHINLTAYEVDALSDTEVIIKDVETPAFDRRYWYGVRIMGPKKQFTLDPELVNKSGTK